MGLDPFSYAALEVLLRAASTVPLGEWDGGPGLLLRHDADLSLVAAHALAAREREWGVRATYFIRVDAPFYNVLAARSRALLTELVEWGFEIGLHHDPGGDPHAEAALLERACGAPVRSLSLHNPSVHGEFPLIEGFRNAYDPRIFAPDRYMSDSRMRFGGDAAAFVAAARERPVQLLLHPVHYSDAGGRYRELFMRHLETVKTQLEAEFAPNPEGVAALHNL